MIKLNNEEIELLEDIFALAEGSLDDDDSRDAGKLLKKLKKILKERDDAVN